MSTSSNKSYCDATPRDFIREIIAEDVRSGACQAPITRFPPEPNGYLHIGHAKAACLSFGIAQEYASEGAACRLRFDDTNPTRERAEFERAIEEDIRWLGFEWEGDTRRASDYFERMADCARRLITNGLAYVCELTADELRAARGNLTTVGENSPYRERTAAESLALFESMLIGEQPVGACVLRAKIDMAAPNMNLRDPTLWRMLAGPEGEPLPRPSYDFAHPLSDAFEKVTHSLCTLEFEDHRPLYDWVVDNSLPNETAKPRQIEFARLNLSHAVLSKRYLAKLVDEKIVHGWDDPRMPTLAGLRRRGFPPAAIREFCRTIGVTKFNGLTDAALLEHAVRAELNQTANRRIAVLDPLRVVLENFPESESETIELQNNPEDLQAGARSLTLSREIWIEREDFAEEPPSKWRRLAPGCEVRLRGAFCIRCIGVDKDPASGETTVVRCLYDESTRNGAQPEERPKVRGVIHWLNGATSIAADEIRIYDRLFNVPNPINKAKKTKGDLFDFLNPNAMEIVTGGKIEPSLADAAPGEAFQFERLGYFIADLRDHNPNAKLIFNRTLPLRESWR